MQTAVKYCVCPSYLTCARARKENHIENSIPCVTGSGLACSKLTHLNATLGMLLWTQEERAVHERIAIEHQHRFLAQNAGDAALLVLRQRGQYEQARLVVAVISFVFHLVRKKVVVKMVDVKTRLKCICCSVDGCYARAVVCSSSLPAIMQHIIRHTTQW